MSALVKGHILLGARFQISTASSIILHIITTWSLLARLHTRLEMIRVLQCLQIRESVHGDICCRDEHRFNANMPDLCRKVLGVVLSKLEVALSYCGNFSGSLVEWFYT